MKPRDIKLSTLICAGALLTTGCATMEQSMGVGGLACAGVGVLTGVLTNNAGIGAGAGAGCMALTSVAIYSYHTSQTRTAEQDQQLYGYTTPVNGTEVKIRDAIASPKTARAGDTIKLALDYSVIAPKGTHDVNVEEKMVLKQNGKELKSLSERTVKRPLGGSGSQVDFAVPAKMPPGTYVIENTVKTGTSYDVRDAVLIVSG
jgi:hypothetical protein